MAGASDAGKDIRKVLVVEDEALVALNLESMLEEMGYAVIGPALRFEAALKLAGGAEDADIAVLDVNVGGKKVFPVAELLAAKGVPVVFATGYGRDGLAEAWVDYPVIQKPYTMDNLRQAMDEAMQSRA